MQSLGYRRDEFCHCSTEFVHHWNKTSWELSACCLWEIWLERQHFLLKNIRLCQGSGRITIPGSAQKTWMWHSRTWFSGGLGSAGVMDLMILDMFPNINDCMIYEATGSKHALHRAVGGSELEQSHSCVWWHSLTLRTRFRYCVGHGPRCHAIPMSQSAGTPSIALDGDCQELLLSHELLPWKWWEWSFQSGIGKKC